MHKQITSSLRRIFQRLGNASIWLFLATIAAIIIANTSLQPWYEWLLSTPVILEIGGVDFFSHHGLHISLHTFVNDALMAVFFFVVGLEIKREILIGELSNAKKAFLPIVAACGGMIVPVLIFLLIQPQMPESRGMAIPMATDIAFALGILALFGKRVPLALKIFLATLAVVDDIGGIMVIAFCYSKEIYTEPLMLAAFCLLLLLVGGLNKINSRFFYYGLGFLVWMFFLESGLHAAIAGVLVALTIPAKPQYKFDEMVRRITRDLKKIPKEVKENSAALVITHRQSHILRDMQQVANNSRSPLRAMIEDLDHFVYYIVLPLFAFVNAGIVFDGFNIADLKGVPLAIGAGLVIGKTLGIFSFTFIYVRLGFSTLPIGMNYKTLLGLSVLGGVGFTVSLFMASLAYSGIGLVGDVLLNQAKFGILGGSLISGLLAYFLLRSSLPKK